MGAEVQTPKSFSPATIARTYRPLRDLNCDGHRLQIITDGMHRAAIIKAEPEKIEGQLRHRIILLAFLKRIASGEMLITRIVPPEETHGSLTQIAHLSALLNCAVEKLDKHK